MRKSAAIALVAVSLLCGAALGQNEQNAGPVKVAVLPFVNRSAEPDFAYIGPMLDHLLNRKIAATEAFDLIDPAIVSSKVRATSFDPAVLESPSALKRTGESLGAEVLITGWYERSGGYLTLETRIYDAEKGNIILGTSDVTMYKDFFATADNVVMTLAGICRVTLDAGAHSRMKANPTNNLGAYSSFSDALMARDAGNVNAALAALDQAIEVDPEFCDALSLAAKLATEANDPRAAGWASRSANCKGR